MSPKGKVKEGVLPLMNSAGEQEITDEKKGEELNWGSTGPPTVSEDHIHGHLENLNKFMEPNEMHSRLLRELADVVANLHPVIFKKSW